MRGDREHRDGDRVREQETQRKETDTFTSGHRDTHMEAERR